MAHASNIPSRIMCAQASRWNRESKYICTLTGPFSPLLMDACSLDYNYISLVLLHSRIYCTHTHTVFLSKPVLHTWLGRDHKIYFCISDECRRLVQRQKESWKMMAMVRSWKRDRHKKTDLTAAAAIQGASYDCEKKEGKKKGSLIADWRGLKSWLRHRVFDEQEI